MQAVFKTTDNADWRTMQALRNSIERYKKMDARHYGETVKKQTKQLREFMARFFPSQSSTKE